MTTADLQYPLCEGYVDQWLWSLDVHASIETWLYARCPEDHSLTIVASAPHDCHTVNASAVTYLHTLTGGSCVLFLTGTDIDRVLFDCDVVWQSHGMNSAHEIPVELLPGKNEIRIDFSIPKTPEVMRCKLRVENPPAGTTVQIPTTATDPSRRAKFERVFEQAVIDRDVFTRGAMVQVDWSSLDERCTTQGRLRHISGRIYGQSTKMLDSETHTLILGKALNIPDGRYDAVIMPDSEEFYGGIGYSRSLPFVVSTSPYSETWYGDLETRRAEALSHAAGLPGCLFGQIARMALGRWSEIDARVIDDSVSRFKTGSPERWREALALIGVMARYESLLPDELKTVTAAHLRDLPSLFPLQPGADDLPYDDGDDLLQRSIALLIEQSNPSMRLKALEADLAHWLQAHGVNGLNRWESSSTLESLILALTHLVDLAESETIRELSAVLLDRLLFGLALNTYKGTIGSARSSSQAPAVLNGRLDPTSGLCRLLWGMGVFNENLAAVVSLCCCEAYEIPSLIQAIALDVNEPLWSRDHHLMNGEEVSKVTYRTSEYMLSSAQAYRSGSPGHAEQVWQATLSPDAVIFTNHPAYATDHSAPGFWCGNAILPRVAQWHDALIAVYQSSEDGMDFTHAYFPLWAFEAHVLDERWAFARVGSAYLALGSANGYALMTTGPGAFRELRAPGRSNVWLCQLGSEAQDGEFSAFQSRVLEQPISVDGLSVRWTTLRGDRLAFGWEGVFEVNDQTVPLEFDRHIENHYCTSGVQENTLDIQVKDYLMRLNFELE